VIEIVVERPLHAVFEENADKACPPLDRRGHLLYHGANAPFLVQVVVDPVAEVEVETETSHDDNIQQVADLLPDVRPRNRG